MNSARSQALPEPWHNHPWLWKTRLKILLGVILVSLSVSAAAPAKELPPLHSIELNHATVIELERLPETGPKLAASIIRFREKSGPFRRIEDLLAIPGITTRRLEKIRPYVRIDASR
jgi:competence ComEA-like helix-hairpin-helix protein